MGTETRKNWVDIAKGIAIIAVVLGHIDFNWPNSQFLPLSDICIWLWHVPVFFMIGGFFLKDEKLLTPRRFILSKAKSLYLLILYIYIPVLLLHNIFLRWGFYDTSIDYYGKFVTWWGVNDFLKHLLAAILFAGREPLLGAMWFVYVLFMALCIISFVTWGSNKIGRMWSIQTRELTRGLIFFILIVASSLFSKSFGLTIPRFSNTLTAIWLIYLGMMIVQKLKVQFSHGLVTIASGIIVWYSAVYRGGVNLVSNEYSDVITLTVSSSASLYIVCYISRKIEKIKSITSVLSYIGRESFYIMGLHFIGFKIGMLALRLFGVKISLAILVPNSGDCAGMFLYYLLFGVGFPLAFMWVLRISKSHIFKVILK